tara:strand:- start:2666 stop:3385 length:720 start_codon:yes stop_codon:yes gene_type:complete
MLKVNEKPCKGVNSDTKGLGCGKPTKYRVLGLGKTCGCYSDFLINTEAGKLRLKKAEINGKSKVEKEKKKKTREERLQDINWSENLQVDINSIVRNLDKGLTCLARNIRGQMHGGHVYARGGNQTIRYNLHNIHRQSAHSNRYQNDDGLLREGLVKEYGSDYMQFISSLRQTPSIHFSNKEFRELTNKARVILKEIKNSNRVYSKSERIELRSRINLELGIYQRRFCEFEYKKHNQNVA